MGANDLLFPSKRCCQFLCKLLIFLFSLLLVVLLQRLFLSSILLLQPFLKFSINPSAERLPALQISMELPCKKFFLTRKRKSNSLPQLCSCLLVSTNTLYDTLAPGM